VKYTREIEVAGDPDAVFAYLADFTNTAEWDPGIVEARRLTEGPTTAGSRFEVVALFRGKRQRFEYVVTEYDERRRLIVLHGEGTKASSDDVISVAEASGRTYVSYEANLRLKGAYRVAEPFVRSAFARMADAALDGLVVALDRSG
jgi:carbon monoxide dehydrogenase subunit G